MRQLTPEHQSKLLKHLLKDDYIEDENKFDDFINSISDSFFRQLLDDMNYVYNHYSGR